MQLTCEAPTIYSGINMINTFTSKQLNLSHIKVVVFSKELAQEGLSPYLHAMIRGREFRPNMNIVISRSSAEAFLEKIKPELVMNTSKYYDLLFEADEYTGFFQDAEFNDFYSYSESLFRNPVAILGGVTSFKSSEDFTDKDSTYRMHGHPNPLAGDYYAGDVPQSGGVESEIMGLAVFDGDRMVGELDGTEAKLHLLSTGEYGHSSWSLPDPSGKGQFVVMDIQQSRHPDMKVNTDSDAPEIHLSLNLEGDFLSIQSTMEYEKGEALAMFETHVEDLIGKEVLAYLEKTAREFQSDICGCGEHAKRNFLTWKEWADYGWKSKYKDAVFTVDVNFKARRPGLIMRSIPPITSEGEVDLE